MQDAQLQSNAIGCILSCLHLKNGGIRAGNHSYILQHPNVYYTYHIHSAEHDENLEP